MIGGFSDIFTAHWLKLIFKLGPSLVSTAAGQSHLLSQPAKKALAASSEVERGTGKEVEIRLRSMRL